MRASPSTRVGGAGMLALVATYGLGRQAYGLFVPVFRDDFGLSLEQLGLLASAAQAGFLVTTVLTGVLSARSGPRAPVAVGCLVLAAGAAATAVASGPVLLAIGVTAAGASAGGTWAPFSDAVVAEVEPAGRARALALVNAGSPVGLVVASVLVLVADERWRLAWWGFAVVGLAAAGVAWRVLPTDVEDELGGRGPTGARWFLRRRSVPLLLVTLGLAVTSGAYFAHAPDTAQAGGLPRWIGPGMWAVLGVTGAAVGVRTGAAVERLGLRVPLAVAAAATAGATVLLLAAGDVVGALGSAGLFGVGFTVGFAVVVLWSQRVFHDHPSTGFTLAIVVTAVGFVVGPSLYGVLATRLGRTWATLAAATPAVVALLVRPAREDRVRSPVGGADRGGRDGAGGAGPTVRR